MSPLTRPQLLIGGTVGIGLIAMALIWAGHPHSQVTDDAFVDGDIVTVSSGAQGKVQAVNVEDNAHVAAGAPLLDLDSEDLALQLEAANASKDAADGQSDEVSAAGGGGALTQARRKSAKAAVTLATIRVAQAKLALARAHIAAPISGYIAHRMVSTGDRVQVSQPLLALVSDRSWITANLKENQLSGIRPGDKADIRIDAFPELRLEAHVESIQYGAGQAFNLLPPENASGNFVKVVQRVPVKLVLDTLPSRPLPPGLSAKVTIHVR